MVQPTRIRKPHTRPRKYGDSESRAKLIRCFTLARSHGNISKQTVGPPVLVFAAAGLKYVQLEMCPCRVVLRSVHWCSSGILLLIESPLIHFADIRNLGFAPALILNAAVS